MSTDDCATVSSTPGSSAVRNRKPDEISPAQSTGAPLSPAQSSSSSSPGQVISASATSTTPYVSVRTKLPDEPDYDDTYADVLDANAQAEKNEKAPDGQLDEFVWTPSPTVHSVRRRAILAAHPEIETLYGSDPAQGVALVITVILQACLAFIVSHANLGWIPFIVICATVSATLNHSLFAAMHESTHRTMSLSKLGSELLGITASLPFILPAAIPFKRYHLDHHIYMGVETMDPDLPTRFEGRFFRSAMGKLLWVACLPFTYTARPIFTRAKSVLPIDFVAAVLQITFDVFIYKISGITGILYLILGVFFSMNFHPFAGHFISEHFIFPGERDVYQETASYYGSFNAITYNVGYHNEHHDFPRVPGSRLPLVRKMAPEFYQMPSEPKWGAVTWKFIFTPDVTPFNRVLRSGLSGGPIPEGLPQKMVLHKGKYPASVMNFWPVVSSIPAGTSS